MEGGEGKREREGGRERPVTAPLQLSKSFPSVGGSQGLEPGFLCVGMCAVLYLGLPPKLLSILILVILNLDLPPQSDHIALVSKLSSHPSVLSI